MCMLPLNNAKAKPKPEGSPTSKAPSISSGFRCSHPSSNHKPLTLDLSSRSSWDTAPRSWHRWRSLPQRCEPHRVRVRATIKCTGQTTRACQHSHQGCDQSSIILQSIRGMVAPQSIRGMVAPAAYHRGARSCLKTPSCVAAPLPTPTCLLQVLLQVRPKPTPISNRTAKPTSLWRCHTRAHGHAKPRSASI